jgi:hypothetical protein
MSDQHDRWPLPEEWYTDDFKCVLLRIPDKPEYITAFYEAYDYLCRWLSWERRGDTSARDAGLLFRRYQPKWVDCEIADEINEDGNMAIEITVNTNCECGSGGGGGGCCCSPFTVPTAPDGTNYPLIPVDPTDPLGDIPPTWDEENEVAPPGYDDWQSFLDDRCRAANWAVDAYIEMVKNADLAERKLSAGGAIMEVVALLLAMLPGPVGDWAGVTVIIKWVTRLSVILLEAVDDLEELNDWLQFGADKIEENKAELICGLYQMTSVEWFTEFYLTFFAGYVSPEMIAMDVDPRYTEWLREITTPLATWLAERSASGFVNMRIPEGYVPSHDCANCGGFAPIEYQATGAGQGTVVLPYTWSYSGDFFRAVDGVIVDQNGVPGPDWVQQDPVKFNIVTQTGIGKWYTRLNSQSASVSNRLQGDLTSPGDIASLIVQGAYRNASFGDWIVRIYLDGVEIVGDFELKEADGVSPTTRVVNLPQVYPAGTVFHVHITSSAGWDEIIRSASFSSTVYTYV